MSNSLSNVIKKVYIKKTEKNYFQKRIYDCNNFPFDKRAISLYA